jgi:peptidoglycan/LPS O-acetylase OafA/YrhL
MREPGAALHRLGYIDALRGYAILGVLIVHSGAQVPGMVPATAWGARGVQLFFVMSALTLMASWSRSNDGAAPFYVRRLFRIAPMFWLALILYVPHDAAWWKIAMTATFTHGLHPETIYTQIVPGGWSIADEALFYLFFPIIAASITSWRRAAWLLAASLVVSVVAYRYLPAVIEPAMPALDPELVHIAVFLSFPLQAPAFATGIFVFHVIEARPEFRPWAAQALLVGAVSALALQCAMGNPHLLQLYDLLFGAVAFALAFGAGRWLVNGAIQYLGKISYSVYLVQFMMLAPAERVAAMVTEQPVLKFWIILGVATTLSGLAASVTYYLIERNGIRLGHALAKRIGAPIREPLVAPESA